MLFLILLKHFSNIKMEKYFESISRNTSKIKGSSTNTTMNLISSFNGFGISQVKSFMERKQVTCLDLRTVMVEAGEKVMKSLPNDFITADEKFNLVANAVIEAIENIYENPMVILIDYKGISELYQLTIIVLMLKEKVKNINWYHLNFDTEAMFKLLYEEQKSRASHNLPERLITLLPVFYKKRDKNIKHSILISKKDIKHKLTYFKKWFENEQSLDSSITNLFNQFEPDNTNSNNIYIHFHINSESFVKYIDINGSDIDNFDDIFSNIDIT